MRNIVAEQLERKAGRKAPIKQVRLKLVYVDFWSAVKFSFVVSMCLAVMNVVLSLLIYLILLQTGVLHQLNTLLSDVAGGDLNILSIVGLPQVLGAAVVCGLLAIVVGTALGAIASLIYNLLARALGGFQLGFTSS
ncbi:DUF3566 domain-containing protein [Canibacter sp. lx-72]|uniref:DUF3566 domain-containing protein n=1 Tax=Canibacter zhuwentaonis TaxID=2837491 RepID=UPI001BDCC79A|nr:DUF3566 domain-containing protein [Canibacter zhuwentaonis]MBT1018127.1 DUF3566 domain-containing protein [Canibacter zhuwentaonis]